MLESVDVRNCGAFCLLGVVTREMFDSMQNAEIISTLTKEFNEVREEKPLLHM